MQVLMAALFPVAAEWAARGAACMGERRRQRGGEGRHGYPPPHGYGSPQQGVLPLPGLISAELPAAERSPLRGLALQDLLDAGQLLYAEGGGGKGAEAVVDLLGAAGADQRGGDNGAAQHPTDR